MAYVEEVAERLLGPVVVNDSKKIMSSRYNMTDTHMISHAVTAGARPNSVPALKKEGGHRVPILILKLFAIYAS